MATDIVGGLFGMTPEQLQMARQAQMQKSAADFAALTPSQQVSYGSYLGGQQLGNALGGLMGAEDPMLKLVQQRQMVAKQIDWSNPQSILQGINLLKDADPAGARGLAEDYRKLVESNALVAQREAQSRRERQQAIPAAIQVATKISELDMTKSQLESMPESPEKNQALRVVNLQMEQLKKQGKEWGPSEIQKLQEYRQMLVSQNAPANQIAEVDAVIRALPKKGTTEIRLPGQSVGPKDWIKFEGLVQDDPTIKKTNVLLSEIPSVLSVVRSSTTNDIAASSLPTALARLAGEGGVLSNQDIARFARTGGLSDRLAQAATSFLTGRATSQQKDQAERFVTAVYRGALLEQKQKYVDQAERLGYTDSPEYAKTIKQFDDKLAQFKLVNQNKPKESGNKPQESDEDLINRYKPKG